MPAIAAPSSLRFHDSRPSFPCDARSTEAIDGSEHVTIEIIRSATSRAHLRAIAASQFGDMVKAVVDLERGIMAVGGEMHADEESALLEDGSAQADLWGINLMIEDPDDDWIEFDSMINIRPSQANRSRAVDDPQRRARIRALVAALVPR